MQHSGKKYVATTITVDPYLLKALDQFCLQRYGRMARSRVIGKAIREFLGTVS